MIGDPVADDVDDLALLQPSLKLSDIQTMKGFGGLKLTSRLSSPKPVSTLGVKAQQR
ncbi:MULTISPECIES: hypothetical protein [Sphingobium]|uniref:hypothetical protein n=1 Tax=Sphingobium TaxID=165695 RepID=UPI0013EB6842|nr:MULTISPECIES: hypothetical protein [Sphingobium]WDA34901.1 hypothetical protein PO876_15665 [Sphingobium sp. YC-XJ3]